MRRPVRLALSIALLHVACAAARPAPDAAREAHWASGKAIALYLEARLAAADGDRQRVLDALRLALVHDPTSPQLRTSYAEALARAGRVDAALGEALRAIELAPRGAAGADAQLALGRILQQARRPEGALKAFEAAARLEGERVRALPEEARDLDPEPWRMLARARFESGDVSGASAACEALALLDRAEGAAGLRELARRLLDGKNAAAAEGRLRRAVELAPGEADGWKLLARLEETRERWAAAREAWNLALRAEPDDPDALQSAAQLALREGDLDGARALLRELVLSSPDEASARLRATAAWLDAKRPAEALEASAGLDDDRILYMRGLALSALRRWGEAAGTLERVTPAAGEVYALARQQLASVLVHDGKPREAVKALQPAVEASPRDPGLLYALGNAQEAAGQHDVALSQMRALLEVKPDHADALNFVAYTLAERGESLAEAQAMAEKALHLEPDNAAFLDTLGLVLLRRGHAGRALPPLERAAGLLAGDATVLEHLGDAYRALHRPDDAAAAYRRALRGADGENDGEGELGAAHRASLERKLEGLRTVEPRPTTSRR
ncbi:MAG TPA: tetratricopeptide repeat protein [Anaeromyxobacteraceae bacterium]|nr:tetratricopeptide repeat protein [Anaeromyxobacteraceae bacterium]